MGADTIARELVAVLGPGAPSSVTGAARWEWEKALELARELVRLLPPDSQAPSTAPVRCCPVCRREPRECACYLKAEDTADLTGLTTDERAARFARLAVLDEAACCLTAEGYRFTTAAKVKELHRWVADLPASIVAGRAHSPGGADEKSRPSTPLDPADLDVLAWPRGPRMQVGLERGVIVHHRPSGTAVGIRSERSQHKNRERALAHLAELVSESMP